MKRTASLLSTLILASMPFWASTVSLADELVVKEAATLEFHCHQQFPRTHLSRFYLEHGMHDEAATRVSDFYGPCDHEPTGAEEIGIQRRNLIDKERE
ncbi:MAG: hypothetical protein OEN50_14775 [Deltaproteobacteria bacterium]|nr:hypothetical protein [Deltaproteobacteria bacterium]